MFMHILNERLLSLEWLVGVHNKEAHKSPDRRFKADTKLWLKCYLT